MRENVRIRIDVAYVGSAFHGWQIQPEFRTVQGELRRCLTRLLGRDTIPVAAGRTDAGVHARGQVAHLTVDSISEADRIARALPGMVPADIGILAVRRVSPAFNARFSAVSRQYSYNLITVGDIFRPFAWYIFRDLDQAAMDEGAAALVGTHDFSSFCKTKSLKEDHNRCVISLCTFDWRDDSAIFQVRANRFLHHMVRIMVGTLVEIGRGERPTDDIPRILAARNRIAAGRMGPAQGLFLEEVGYPQQLMDPDFVPVIAPQITPEGDSP